MNQKPLPKRKCKNCEEEFQKKTSLQYVCSPKCEREWKAKKEAERQEKEAKTQPSRLLAPKKPIAPISKKMKGELAIYKPIRDQYMKEHEYCECGCGEPATDLHHKAGRTGYYDLDSRFKGLKLLWDKRFFMATARSCHNHIHEHPEWAYQMGYLIKAKV